MAFDAAQGVLELSGVHGAVHGSMVHSHSAATTAWSIGRSCHVTAVSTAGPVGAAVISDTSLGEGHPGQENKSREE